MQEVFVVSQTGRTPADGVPSIVFVSGFPDTVDTFVKVRKSFELTHSVVSLAFAGMEGKRPRMPMFGWSFQTVINELTELVRICKKGTNGGQVVLAGHDWGAMFAQIVVDKHPELVDRTVFLDIGMDVEKAGFVNMILLVLYQMFMITAFIVGVFFPGWGKRLLLLYPWSIIGPVALSEIPGGAEKVETHMCWLYFQELVYLGYGRNLPSLPKEVPVLFIYGKKKRLHFHSQFFSGEA
eukprot:Selendium_serpulae@DN6182_c2_g4_i3.p1